MTDDEPEEAMECGCGSPDCRRVVAGRDWMKKEVQDKYDGYFFWFIQIREDAQKSARK